MYRVVGEKYYSKLNQKSESEPVKEPEPLEKKQSGAGAAPGKSRAGAD